MIRILTILKAIARGGKYTKRELRGTTTDANGRVKNKWRYWYATAPEIGVKEEQLDPGHLPSPAGSQLRIEPYSDKAIAIVGDTKKHLDLIRKLKDETRSGFWHAKKKVWLFPAKLRSKIENALSTVSEPEHGKPSEVSSTPNVTSSPETDPLKIANIIESTTPDTRNTAVVDLFGAGDGIQNSEIIEQQSKIAASSFQSPEIQSRTFGQMTFDTLDFTGFPPNLVQLPPKQKRGDVSILDQARPSYIPEINEELFRRGSHRLQAVQLGDGKYLIPLGPWQPEQPRNESWRTSTNLTEEEKQAFARQVQKENDIVNLHRGRCAIVSAEVLVATQEWFSQRAQAILNKKTIEKRDLNIKYWQENYGRSADYATKEAERRFGFTKIRLMEYKREFVPGKGFQIRTRISTDHRDLYRKVVGSEWEPGTSGGGGPNGESHRVFSLLEDMHAKLRDISLQKESDSATYKKGLETSFGDSGLSSALLASEGVKVKRQNGKPISEIEIKELQEALSVVRNAFGDRSEMARKYGLKVSHSGEKLAFARKAVGLFVPQYKVIAVSAKGKMGFTLAHEFAHFMDHSLGRESKRNYASDNYDSTAGKIARTFMQNMTGGDRASDYYQRTCECFARALEQYAAIKSGDRDSYSREDFYMPADSFDSKVAPLVEQFLSENDLAMKSLFATLARFDSIR